MSERINERVQTTDAWLQEHEQHRRVGERFGVESIGHPDGNWVKITCPCGARHTTNTEPKGLRHVREKGRT